MLLRLSMLGFWGLAACSEPPLCDTDTQQPEMELRACPRNWAPVCGEDGVRYPNGCSARCSDVSYVGAECGA